MGLVWFHAANDAIIFSHNLQCVNYLKEARLFVAIDMEPLPHYYKSNINSSDPSRQLHIPWHYAVIHLLSY